MSATLNSKRKDLVQIAIAVSAGPLLVVFGLIVLTLLPLFHDKLFPPTPEESLVALQENSGLKLPRTVSLLNIERSLPSFEEPCEWVIFSDTPFDLQFSIAPDNETSVNDRRIIDQLNRLLTTNIIGAPLSASRYRWEIPPYSFRCYLLKVTSGNYLIVEQTNSESR